MTVPDYQSFMLPVLQALGNGQPMRWRDLREPCIRAFDLTTEDTAEQFERGGSVLDSRVQWATTYLVQAGHSGASSPRTRPRHGSRPGNLGQEP